VQPRAKPKREKMSPKSSMSKMVDQAKSLWDQLYEVRSAVLLFAMSARLLYAAPGHWCGL
jgi:hypothetical protein